MARLGTVVAVLVGALVTGRPAAAEPKVWERSPLVLATRAGGWLPGPFNALDAGFAVEIEAEYVPRTRSRWLALFLTAGYARAVGRREAIDSRVQSNGGVYSAHAEMHDSWAAVGLMLLSPERPERIRVHGGLGARVSVVSVAAIGSAGETTFPGTVRDTRGAPGLLLRAGLLARIGPGAISAEGRLCHTPFGGTIVGRNVSAFGVLLGYALGL